MIEKIKKSYSLICILALISSFLFLFRNQLFIADKEFVFTVLPQAAIARHIGFLDNFWNSYTGCGLPFFPQPWSKFYSVSSIFFRFFSLKTGYILFFVTNFIMAYFAFYFLAKYFYREKYIPTFLSLLYVSSGMFYGYFSTNYHLIEYNIIGPLMILVACKYIDAKKIGYLILLGLLSIYANLGLRVVAIITILFMLNLFIIFYVYARFKKIKSVLYYLCLINAVIISVNLFKLVPTVEYYFIEGVRGAWSYNPRETLYTLIGPLHCIFLSGHFPINLHYLSFFLIITYFFYPINTIEKVSLKTFISIIGITYFSYICLFLLDCPLAKNITLHKILGCVHIPGTLMLGTGIRAFVVTKDRKKERKAIAFFAALWIILYILYAVKKQSFNIGIMNHIKWPFIFGTVFSAVILLSGNIRIRKVSFILLILVFGMSFIHVVSPDIHSSDKSFWRIDNTYHQTYLNDDYNKEVLDALGREASGKFTYTNLDELYRLMSYEKNKKYEEWSLMDNMNSGEFKKIPFFSIINYPILFGIQTIHNHENVFLKRYATFMEILEDYHYIQQPGMRNSILYSPLFPLLNVKYIFSYDNIDIKGYPLYRKLKDKKTSLYINTNLLPRFFVTDNFISYRSKEEFLKIVNGEDVDFSKTVLIENYLVSTGQNINKTLLDYKIRKVQYKNDSVKIDLVVNKGSIFVLLDNYYPGWQAYINGRKIPIYPAYLTFRAIHLPDAGSYKIEFKYYPTFFKQGIFIATVVFILLFLWLIYEKRKTLLWTRNII